MLCLVDGEHYLPVTQEAIDTLNNLEHIDVTVANQLNVYDIVRCDKLVLTKEAVKSIEEGYTV